VRQHIFEIARHELRCALKTRRIVAMLAMYLGLAIIGGGSYAVVVDLIEEQSIEALVAQGQSLQEALETLRLQRSVEESPFERWLAGLADGEQIADALKSSSAMVLFLWVSLNLFPFLCVVSFFDQLSGPLRSRTLRLSALRVSRASMVWGRIVAHSILFVCLSGLGTLSMVMLVGVMLDSVSLVDCFLGICHLWVCLAPVGICFVALTAWLSAAPTATMPTLVTGLIAVVALRLVANFRFFSVESKWALLHYLHYLSPFSYVDGFWRTGLWAPLSSVLIFLVFGLVFGALGVWRLEGQDL
jgi:ABC-type transport system involved in multi-copper enzyme maturation permease subunit